MYRGVCSKTKEGEKLKLLHDGSMLFNSSRNGKSTCSSFYSGLWHLFDYSRHESVAVETLFSFKLQVSSSHKFSKREITENEFSIGCCEIIDPTAKVDPSIRLKNRSKQTSPSTQVSPRNLYNILLSLRQYHEHVGITIVKSIRLAFELAKERMLSIDPSNLG
ncbi:predicted protein [Sclerotinia sclerotiorum 1980 UF-70]|uniref:Uncharacterized protein n=1 Tax=Sclerotinia sclerotiorum (strain ATCC 18683 / 1980 / Ss-1) TaxID=665079 RepID=A7ENR3_SCLS1|nr:predicted protein [Sclerotinia sclerotiorum 1980 UF-70]EDO04479.1 predicted protein [Sclerotinia sclerotiorum 1980 UF-70]